VILTAERASVKKHEPSAPREDPRRIGHHKRMKMIILVVASLVLFVVAAKVHGRSIRLEREAMGVMNVTFGGPPGSNPPEVEALWRADRWRFWPMTGVLALLFGAATFALTRSAGLTALAALQWAPTVSFFVCAVLSMMRNTQA
jgi:hypothetical protein